LSEQNKPKLNFDPRQFDKGVKVAKKSANELADKLSRQKQLDKAKEERKRAREQEYLCALEYVFRGWLQPWQKEAALKIMKQYQSGQEITFTLPDGRTYRDGAAN
jgi:hypothetical protein